MSGTVISSKRYNKKPCSATKKKVTEIEAKQEITLVLLSNWFWF